MYRRVCSVDSPFARKRSLASTDKLNELADFCFLTNISSCTLTGANRCADDTGDLSDPSTLYTTAGSCINCHVRVVYSFSVILTLSGIHPVSR